MNVPVINHLAALVIARSLAESRDAKFDYLSVNIQEYFLDQAEAAMKSLEETGWRLVPYGPKRK